MATEITSFWLQSFETELSIDWYSLFLSLKIFEY